VTQASPLELSEHDFREMIALATREIVRHVASLPKQPMHATGGGRKLAKSLRESLPETGEPFEALAKLLFSKLIPRTFNTASPGYMAYIPGGGLLHAAVANLIADSVNRYVGVWIAAPGLAQLEANVVQWLCEIVGYQGPTRPGGVLTSGGSMSNLIALVTARQTKLGDRFDDGVVYVSDQAHHSVLKAARFAGFRDDQVRVVATDARFRLSATGLREAIARDLHDGNRPFLVVASAGTTNTGAIDDLNAVADVAAESALWLHVDGAYGGFFAMTARGKRALRGLERADSVTLDPHKSLFLPYGTGALVVRDAERLRAAHAMHATYLPPMQAEVDFADFCDLGPELSRDFRGLRVWLPLKLHGAGVFRAALDEKLDLAQAACEAIRQLPGVEIVAEPELSLFAFCVSREGADARALDKLNRAIMKNINSRQRVLVTGTMARGRFVLRVCILSFRTHADRVAMLIEDVALAVARAGA
jgi:aromatic-L-amino-acid decarboxylase